MKCFYFYKMKSMYFTIVVSRVRMYLCEERPRAPQRSLKSIYLSRLRVNRNSDTKVRQLFGQTIPSIQAT